MRQRKRRFSTALLCAVLILSNVLPAGMPVYAKSPDAGSDMMSAAYINEAETLTDGSSEITDAVNNNKDAGDSDASGTDHDADNNNDGIDSDIPDSGSGSPDSDDADSGNTDTPDDGNGSDADNANKPDDGDGSDADDANRPDDGDGSDGNDTDTPDGSDGSDADTPDSGDDSDPDDNDGNTDGNESDEGNTSVPGDDPDADGTPKPDENTSVSENDVEENGETAEELLPSFADGDYPIEDPEGFNLTDITMTPGSYSAAFSAVSAEYVSEYNFKIAYTTDAALAADFLKGKSKATQSELTAAGFKTASLQDFFYDYRSDDTTGQWVYHISGAFTGDGALSPNTTYYYRPVYQSSYDYENSTYYYYFLSAPDEFQTKEALETSSVSIKDIVVEDIGYQKAKVVWTVDNPDQVPISRIRLSYTDGTMDGKSFSASSYEYRNEQNQKVPNKYYATVDQSQENLPWVKKAKVTMETYIGDAEPLTIESEEIDVSLKDVNAPEIELTVTEKTGTSSFQTLVELTPYYSVDGGLALTLYYRSKGTDAWLNSKKGSLSSAYSDATSASAAFSISGLSAAADYEYYIEATGPLAQRTVAAFGSAEAPLTFTTREIETYEDTDFPDEVFRSFIRSKAGISDSDKITSDKLESLTSLTLQRSSASGEIRSLQGIEHIPNLTRIDFRGHSIANAGGLAELANLTSINLSYNDLTDVPDLSGMSQLSTANFDGNQISSDKVAAAKLPTVLLAHYPHWVTSTISSQRGDVKAVFAPEYFASEGTRPFLVKISGLKKDSGRKYTLSFTVDGKTVSGSENSYNSYDMYYLEDIAAGITVTEDTPCQATVTLTDQYGNTWLEQSQELTFTGDTARPVAQTKYIRPNAASVYIDIKNLPETYTEDNITSVELTDVEGTRVGNQSSYLNAYVSSYNPYEDTFGSFSLSGLTVSQQRCRLSTTIRFAKYLTAGDYRAVITCADGTSCIVDKAVHVDHTAVLESVSIAENYSNIRYDNFGDYLYVRLYGINIDPSQVWPTLYAGDTAVTEYVGAVSVDTEECIYKLKKLQKDTYWYPSMFATYTCQIEAKPDYEFINLIKDNQLTLMASTQDFVVFEHYNYKKGFYEVKTDASVTPETSVSVSVYSDSGYKTCMGTAEAKVTEDHMLSLAFKDDLGQAYAPPQYQNAYFRYTYADIDGVEQTFTHSNYVDWYNYSDAGDTGTGGDRKTAYSNTVRYHKQTLKKLELHLAIPNEEANGSQSVSAQIYTSEGDAFGNSVTLAKGKNAGGYISHTGTWTDTAGLTEGVYTVRYTLNGNNRYNHTLCVYDDQKFYMNNQWFGTWSGSSGSGHYITFSSEQLAGNYIHDYGSKVDAKTALSHWNTGGYKLELFDRLGNPITGWKTDHAAWSGSSFTIYLTALPEGYTGVYAKITRNSKLGVSLDNGNVYYAQESEANEQYGQWHSIGNSGIWLNSDSSSNTNAYYGFGSNTYPVTVTVTKPYDTDVIHTFKVPAATSGSSYYFTEADLKPVDPKEAYRITAVNANGSSDSRIGYLAVRNTGTATTVKVTGVTLDKTALNMQLGQTEKLTASVKPDNATNKNVTWTSSDSAVATVDAQGNVTAVSTGETTITVKTADSGKTAACTVKVFNYTLNKTALSFDLSDGASNQTETLKVSDGVNDISGSVTWSSNDESVATVENGAVTPQGAGAAKILAEIKNGPTLTCDVTVSRNTLTEVTLSETACTLYLDSKGQPVSQMPNTKQLKLYLTPADATVSGIKWASGDPTVASVSENESGTAAVVTALKKGTAEITATVTTKNGTKTAKCKITVQTVTTETDVTKPAGLTALTNEQLTLTDVALPDGWEWLYPDVSLKQFSGMQEKAFAAKYTNPTDSGAVPYETELSVALSTVTGIAIGADSSTLRQSQTADLSIIWSMNGSQLDLSEYAKKITWSSAKESVANIQPADGKEAYAKLAAVGTGSTTIKAQITFKDGKTYKAQYKVTVVDGEAADIQVTGIDRFTADPDQQNTYRGRLESDASLNSSAIHVTVTGADKLTVKNNNAKVIAAGKAAAAENGFSIPLTVKAAGMAQITLIANDKAKTQKTLYLHVTDVKPNISESTLTVNLWQTTGTAFSLYPCEGYQVTETALAGDSKAQFTLTPVTQTGTAKYIIAAKDGTVKGSYKLTLQGKVKSLKDNAESAYDNVSFTVKVIEQAPKYKIKQSAKVNLFYTNWDNSLLNITSDEILESAELTGCDFTTVQAADGSWHIKATKNTQAKPLDLSRCNKKGTLTLKFSGYKDVTTNLTIAAEKKAPSCKLKNTSMTVYPTAGLNSAVLNPTVYQPDGTVYADVNYTLDNNTYKAGFIVEHENSDNTGDFLIRYTKDAANLKDTSYKASFTLTHDSWTDKITVPFTVKVSAKKPAAKLGKATLQLNSNTASMAYDTAATEVMWKDGAKFNPNGVSVSAADAKARSIINTGIVFTFDRANNCVIAKLNNTTVAKGSYKFKVNVKATDTLTVSTPLTVKIVDVSMDKAIKVSTKGNIDVLNREGTYVTATPALKSLNGSVTGVRLSGRAAHLFHAECAENNKVIIHAKQNAALITKYNYKVKLNLTITNAEGTSITYTTPEVGLTLKQGKPKVTIAPKNTVLFSGSYEGITRNISASLKGAADPTVTNVELINNNDTFTCAYDSESGVITLYNTPNAVKGKSYSLQLKVTYKGQADNEKATIIKYSVRVQ